MEALGKNIQIGVIGAGECDRRTASTAYEVGKRIAQQGASLVCGGLGGVMEHASRGALEAGGCTIGVLPGDDALGANPYIRVAVPTGMGHARNVIVVRSAMALIAIEGSYGTLSEIAIALKLGKPVIGLNTWDIGPDIHKAATPDEAVNKAISLIKQ